MMSFLRNFAILGLVLASQTVASPVKRAPTLVVSVSTTKANAGSIDEISIHAKVHNTVSPLECTSLPRKVTQSIG